jgi:IS30 family transposase
MKQIGEKLGRDKSSISRELKRGTKNRIYSPLTGEAHKRNMRKRLWIPGHLSSVQG